MNPRMKKNLKFVVDVEADGPCPGLYSMVSFGVVAVHEPNVFYYSDIIKPLPGANSIPEALAVSKITVEEQLAGREPNEVMHEFKDWLETAGGMKPMFFSDNNGFDWQFINYYFHLYCNFNPFGHSSTNINSLYKGMCRNMRVNIKKLRKTRHTHHPVDDSRGNVEALKAMQQKGLKL